MSKSHHQTKEEQINNRLYDAVRSRKKKIFSQMDELASTEIQEVAVVDERSIQLRSYQIHQEKGGTAFDNWLEAERILKNIESPVLGFLNEGNPNS